MIQSIFLLSLVLPAADPPLNQQSAVPMDDEAQLRQQVVGALLQHRLDGFEGTVAFEKEFWFPPKDRPTTRADATGYSRQQWEITTDGRTAIVARIMMMEGSESPDGKLPTTPMFAGEDATKIWSTRGRALFIIEKDGLSKAEELDQFVLSETQQLTRQAWAELSEIFAVGRLVGPGVSIAEQVESARREGQNVEAVVRQGDEKRIVTFEKVGDTLMPKSMRRVVGAVESNWTFSEYQQVGGERWVPGVVQWEGATPQNESMTVRTSNVRLIPATAGMALVDKLAVPSRAAGPYQHIIMAQTFGRTGVSSRQLVP